MAAHQHGLIWGRLSPHYWNIDRLAKGRSQNMNIEATNTPNPPVVSVATQSPVPHLPQPPAHGSVRAFAFNHAWTFAFVVTSIMVVLALVGVGVTNAVGETSSNTAYIYWVSLVPVYGIFCIALAWVRGQRHDKGQWTALLRQLVLWLGIGGALAIDFSIRKAGVETGAAAGFTAMLLLALGCYVAGIYHEWLCLVVAVLITAALILAIYVDEYLWLIGAIGALSLALIAFVWWRFGARREAAQPATIPIQPVSAS
jgi:hypothetical protein